MTWSDLHWRNEGSLELIDADHERAAAQAIAFYTASLPPETIDADLAFFARYYLDSSREFFWRIVMLHSLLTRHGELRLTRR